VLIDGGAFHCDGCVFEDCSGTNGGAVHLTDSSGPIDVLIENSSFIDNRATNAGGAIYLDNTRAESSILLVNTTFHENDTVGSGGGIWTNGDRLRIRSSTFSANVANSTGAFLARGGGVAVTGGYVVPVENSILWNNVHCETFAAGNCTSYALDDCSGILASNGFNIVRAAVNGVCAVTGGHSTADPLLLDLDHHGGSTRTLPVPPGSPAIDAANPAGCSVDRDQRGEPRPDVGQGLCDLGAVEATGLLFDDDFELWEWKWSDVQQLPAAAGGSFSE
jgi:predicted outer membrane repeat protein